MLNQYLKKNQFHKISKSDQSLEAKLSVFYCFQQIFLRKKSYYHRGMERPKIGTMLLANFP